LKKVVFGLCGAVLLGWIGFKLLPNEEKAIRNMIERVVQTASIPANEGNLTRIKRANQLADFFSSDVTVNLDGMGYQVPPIHSRSDLLEAALMARSQLRQAAFQMAALHVAFPPGKKKSATAYVLVTGQINHEPDSFFQELRMDLQKIEHRWMIAGVSVVQGLQ
jgi:hypothetical protein